MERSERPTIMDGKVVDIAQSFEDVGHGIFGRKVEPRGPYHVSASRNLIVVHEAELRSTEDVDALIAALQVAHNTAASLARKDRGNFNGDERACDVPYPPHTVCTTKTPERG